MATESNEDRIEREALEWDRDEIREAKRRLEWCESGMYNSQGAFHIRYQGPTGPMKTNHYTTRGGYLRGMIRMLEDSENFAIEFGKNTTSMYAD